MTDLELIYVILAVFYVAECGYWVRPGSLVFASHLGERCRLLVAHTSAWLRNDRGGFVLGNLLPLGHSFPSAVWPVTLAPEGAVSGSCQLLTPDGKADDDGRFVIWDKVRNVTADGRQVFIDGWPFVKAATPALARRLAALLTELAALAPEEREPAIDKSVMAWLNADEFAAAFRRRRRVSTILILPCTALFGFLFVATPVLYAYYVFHDFLSPVPYYLGLLALVLVSYHAAQAALGASSEAWSATVTMLISPADAMHARDKLFHGLAIGYHPLAVASVVCGPAGFREFARQVLLDLRAPLSAEAGADSRIQAAEQWFRARLLTATEAFLRDAKLEPYELLPHPVAERLECRSYCPRCLGQYVVETGQCSVCGLALRSLAEPPPPPPPRPAVVPPPAKPTAQPALAARPISSGANRPAKKRKRKKRK